MRDTSGQDITIEPQARNKKRFTIWGVLIIAITVIGFGIVKVNELLSADQSVSVNELRTARVIRGDLIQDINTQGQVVSANSPTLYAPHEGVAELLVKAGETVEAGQLLVKIDSPELTNQLAQEEARLDELKMEVERQQIENNTRLLDAKQTIEQSEVNLNLQRKNMSRAQLSISQALISKQSFEVIESEMQKEELAFKHAKQAYDLLESSLAFELKTKKRQLERQQFVVDDLHRQLEQLSLRSPLEGIVGLVNIRDRDHVAMNAPLITVVDLSHFEVKVAIAESYADSLSPGLEAVINVNNRDYKGTVTAISPEVNNGEVVGLLSFNDGTPEGLRQNQRVNAQIFIQTKKDVLKVRRGQFVESGGSRIAYVVNGDQALKTSIRLGAKSLREVEVLQGLEENQEIVISNLESFNRKPTIQIIN
ncbi:efflux RND transporter periplasmic adaptor subunit [Pseudoalteromonas sp. T1lg65]|uniref:efflux RND transporter periplasmic adaptor subunit n=1 Tax=Pseudoalteromonas sp. T1lg65 TaxID=2077101 RepID=UPI003F790EF3